MSNCKFIKNLSIIKKNINNLWYNLTVIKCFERYFSEEQILCIITDNARSNKLFLRRLCDDLS